MMRSKFLFHLCMLCTFTLALAGCKVKRPSDVIPESKMEDLLHDYYLAKSMSDNLPYSENYKKALYMEAVFKKYGTSEAIFDSSMVWYTRNTEIFAKISEKVKKRLKEEQTLLNAQVAKYDKKPLMTAEGDSIDVWPWQRLLRLTTDNIDNSYVFTLPSDSNYNERDTLVWEMRYRFLNTPAAQTLKNVTVAMQIIYEKDTLKQWNRVVGEGTQQIRLFADTLGPIKEIRGFIYYPKTDDKNHKGTLLVDRISMLRYHCQDTLAFASRDSINKVEQLKTDSLKKISDKHGKDSLLKKGEELKDNTERLTPEEMNRRRTKMMRDKSSEQIKIEQHIQQERLDQKKERQVNQRRRQQQR